MSTHFSNKVSLLFSLLKKHSENARGGTSNSFRGLLLFSLLTAISLLDSARAYPAANGQGMIVRNNQPRAVIVVGNDAGSLDRFVADELQKHIQTLSGAKLEIKASREVSTHPKGDSLLLVGSPASNELVGQAAKRRQVSFEGLKPDGYVLRRISLDGRPALVLGGNDEAATMYAAYDFLERLGFVFLLTKDMLPQKQADVPLPSLNERVEPGKSVV